MKYDLIIIGSGSVGAAAGYYATRAGLNVLMTDAHMPPHQHGSHHGDTRLIRHAYGEGEKYVPLVLRAQTLWDELSRHNEDDPIFVRSGVINLGPADSAFLANVAHSAEQWQLNVEKLDAQGIMARWPEIRVPDNYIGLFETDSGFLRSELAIKTWIQLAKEAGCAQLFNCPVTAIRHDDDGVTIETKPSRSCAMYCRVSVAACTALPAPMIIRLTKILLSIPYPATIIHCSLPA